MIFKHIELSNFRNIAALNMEPFEKVNIICGENAQGKTNLMEALWLFTGAKSFRQTKDREFIKFGEERAELNARFFAEGREQDAEIVFNPNKTIKKNGLEMKTAAEYAGTCGGVVFTPAQMNLFRDGPKERRRLCDTSLCQLYPKYISVLTEYKRVMEQRNAVLKDAQRNNAAREILDVFDKQLANLGGFIVRTRVHYCCRLNEKAKEIYAGISGGREEFHCEYKTTLLWPDAHAPDNLSTGEWADKFSLVLGLIRDGDIDRATTTTGPHRDDIEVTLDGQKVGAFGSQGQQRSCILALKLAEAKLLGEAMGEPPLILLDDVMSELDANRRDYILNSIGESQIFLTCCDKELFNGLKEGKVFRMNKGEIFEE